MNKKKEFRNGPMYFALIMLLFSWFVPTTMYAGIYGYVGDGGDYHFTNIKPANGRYQILIETKEFARGPGQGISRPWRSDEERYSLINQAKRLLGVPYKFGGDGLTGIDCSAFVRRIFSSVDVALPRTAREQYDVGMKIPRQELTTGDLVFFRTKRYEQYPTHVGIFMGNGQFIHASALNKGSVRIDSLSTEFYNARFLAGTRVRAIPESSESAMIAASR